MGNALRIAAIALANGRFRVEDDGTVIQELHDKILALTYQYCGHAPE